jgi:TP901-1 family phage major tail protein
MADGFKGRELLIQRVEGGVATTIAGGRSKSISINNEMVDVTTSDNAPWRRLLADAGISSLSFSISGVFTDDASLAQAMEDTLARTIDQYVIVSENGDSFTGDFQITSLERSGEYNDAEQYSMTIESSGEPVYLPASS